MGKTILVVDDSATIRKSVSHILTEAGYQIVEADDGQTAVGHLNNKLDLIITDLNMPGMDGLSLIKQVRATAFNKYTPILMLTTESRDERKAEGKQAGATDWIVKPFVPDKLLAVVEKVLR